MKSLIIIFGTILFLIAMPFLFTAIDEMVTEDVSQSFADTSTNATETAVNVTLTQALHEDAVAFVSSVTSNVSADTPTATAFNSVSDRLQISGLISSTNRTILINYAIPSSTLPDAALLFLDTVVRWFLVFAVIGMFGGAIYAFFQS